MEALARQTIYPGFVAFSAAGNDGAIDLNFAPACFKTMPGSEMLCGWRLRQLSGPTADF